MSGPGPRSINEQSEESCVPNLTILPSGKTVMAPTGSTLLEAITAAGEKLTHECDGNVECGTCHIFVHDGRKTLSKMQRSENAKLDTIVGVGSKSRLACQAMLGSEDVTVELLGFASGR
jgi:ferredoxin, 2Fe-2S